MSDFDSGIKAGLGIAGFFIMVIGFVCILVACISKAKWTKECKKTVYQVDYYIEGPNRNEWSLQMSSRIDRARIYEFLGRRLVVTELKE